MKLDYHNSDNKVEDLEIFESRETGESIFTVFRDGERFLDLLRDREMRWIEVLSGGSERAMEYGNIISMMYLSKVSA